MTIDDATKKFGKALNIAFWCVLAIFFISSSVLLDNGQPASLVVFLAILVIMVVFILVFVQSDAFDKMVFVLQLVVTPSMIGLLILSHCLVTNFNGAVWQYDKSTQRVYPLETVAWADCEMAFTFYVPNYAGRSIVSFNTTDMCLSTTVWYQPTPLNFVTRMRARLEKPKSGLLQSEDLQCYWGIEDLPLKSDIERCIQGAADDWNSLHPERWAEYSALTKLESQALDCLKSSGWQMEIFQLRSLLQQPSHLCKVSE